MQTDTPALYKDFSAFLSTYLDGKVQKVSVDAGFTCPNRDGTKGVGGCIYCNNRTFSPDYCAGQPGVTEQLREGIRFFARKYPDMRYLAYFQAYTNTYAPLEKLRRLYEEALAVEGVAGIVVGTRPDCVDERLLDYLSELAMQTFVLVEYGVETANDATLRRIGRGHDFACAVAAIRQTAGRGVHVGAHLLFGLPGESRTDMLRTAECVASLPLETLKLHQLQIVRGSRLAAAYLENPASIPLFTPEAYVALCCDVLERLSPEIAVERFTAQAPADLLIAPAWGMKNYVFTELVKHELRQRGSRQGSRFRPKKETFHTHYI